MKNSRQQRKSVITVSVIILIAILGLVFVHNDYVAADKNVVDMPQTESAVDNGAQANFGESVSVMPSLIRIFSALVLVIAAIYGGIYLLKKLMGRRYAGIQSKGNLEVLETIHIAPRKTITLLRVGEKSVLVGSTESSMSMLTEMNSDETNKLTEEVEVKPAPDAFGGFLKSAVEKFKEVTRKNQAAL